MVGTLKTSKAIEPLKLPFTGTDGACLRSQIEMDKFSCKWSIQNPLTGLIQRIHFSVKRFNIE